MSEWAKKFGILLILGALVTSGGCALFVVGAAGVGAGVGASEYIRGEMKQAYAATMEKSWNAVLTAMDQLKMKASEKSIDNMDRSRLIKGKTDDQKDLQIALEALAPDVTAIKVRIGLFGDEAASKGFQEAVARNLKK